MKKVLQPRGQEVWKSREREKLFSGSWGTSKIILGVYEAWSSDLTKNFLESWIVFEEAES